MIEKLFGGIALENGSSSYHFVTHWRIRGAIGRVYAVLRDGAGYSTWWRPAYRLTEDVGSRKVRSVVRGWLPYTLDFTTELVREEPPKEMELRATGDLVGRGLWRLRQSGPVTEVDFFWDVQATKPLIRRLSFLLKPLFRWNHDWVMRVGEMGLQSVIRNIPGPSE